MAHRKPDYDAVIKSPLGRLGILADEALTRIDFMTLDTPLKAARTPLARKVCAQLKRYFADGAVCFDVPLAPTGTLFQRRVWREMQRIPAGQAHRYGQLAARLGSGPRAVGGACRANPIPIVVPCHRVVAANGDGGYMGATRGRRMDIKRWLLAHERHR